MAYGPKNQEDFFLLLLRIAMGGGLKTQIMKHLLTPVDDRNLYSNGHTCRTTYYSFGSGTV